MRPSKLPQPFRITLLYVLFGGLWIILSDQFLYFFVFRDAQEAAIQTYKGWFFVLVSGILLYTLLVMDLAKRKRTEEALGRSQAQMSGIFHSAMDAIITTDADQRILMFNPAAETMFRCSQADAIGQPLERFIPQRYRSVHSLHMHNFAQTGETKRAMGRLGTLYGLRSDGEEFSIEASISKTEAEGKNLFTVIVRDVTERNQIERQTLQLKRLYATLSQVNQTIVRVKDQQELFESICKVAVEFGEFRLAWIGLYDRETGQLAPAAEYGVGGSKLPFQSININDPPFKDGLIGLSADTGLVQFSDDIQSDARMTHWREVAVQDGYHSVAAVPIRQRGQIIGFLNLYAADIGFFSVKEEQDLLEEMGLDISFALDMMENEAERKQGEQDLQLANARFQHMIDANVIGISIADPNGRIMLANDYYLRVLNATRQEFLEGKVDWKKLTPPEWLHADEKAIQELREHGVCKPYEKEYVHADGTRVAVYIVVASLPGPGDQAIAFILDITERKQAEEQIQNMSRFPSENPSPVMRVTQNGTLLYANLASEELLKTWNWEIGRPVTDEWQGYISQAFQSGVKLEIEIETAGKYYTYVLSPVPSASYINIYGHNITRRKLTEQALRENEERLRLSLQAANQGLYDLNVQTGDAVVNREYAQMLGYDPDTFVETNAAWIERLHPDDRESVANVYSEYISGLLPEYRVEFRQRTKDNNWKWILSLGKVIEYDGEGKPLRMLGTHTDITERKQAEEEIQSRSRQLAALLETSQSLTESLNLEAVLQKITDQSADILGVETSAIYLSDGEKLYLGASTPSLPSDLPEELRQATAADHPHVAQALASKQHVILSDTGNARLTTAEQSVANALGLRTILYVPLIAKKDADGVLIFGTVEQPREFSKNEIDLARTLSNQAALAISNARLYEDLARYAKELENQIHERRQAEEKLKRHISYLTGLREVDQAIASSFDVRLSLNIITSRAAPLLKVDAATILLLDPVMNVLEYGAGHGFLTKIAPATTIRLSESYAGRAVLERHMVHIPNLNFELQNFFRIGFLKEEDFVSYCGVPLIVKGKVVGVMEVFNRTLVERNQEWFDFLNSLAGQAAIAIDNARLWEQVQRHARDLERRVAERTAALNRTNAELEHANRAKDEFLANMSHELRTPLNSILGLSESLLEQRRDPLTEYQQRSLEIISSSGHHLLELINDVLDLSKIEAGKFDHFPQTVNIDMLCRSSLAFVRSQAARKSITITYNNEASTANISADPRRLKQILVNLLTNAVKFTPEGGQVTLETCLDPEQDLVEFSITDTGIGITAQDLKRLFQPFVQVDSKLNRQFEGTGLGLALVHKLTDMHGGSVHVESEVGTGSRFTVRLPWGQEVMAQQSSPGASAGSLEERSEISSVPTAASRSELVLLAEDNAANILTIGEYLESNGYRIVKAHDGLEAIERAQMNDPDIILMDIQMPVMDGMEAIRQLRANPRFRATPIIAITALAMPGDRERCLEAGANEYLSKPIRLKLLKQTIESLFPNSSSAERR